MSSSTEKKRIRIGSLGNYLTSRLGPSIKVDDIDEIVGQGLSERGEILVSDGDGKAVALSPGVQGSVLVRDTTVPLGVRWALLDADANPLPSNYPWFSSFQRLMQDMDEPHPQVFLSPFQLWKPVGGKRFTTIVWLNQFQSVEV